MHAQTACGFNSSLPYEYVPKINGYMLSKAVITLQVWDKIYLWDNLLYYSAEYVPRCQHFSGNHDNIIQLRPMYMYSAYS